MSKDSPFEQHEMMYDISLRASKNQKVLCFLFMTFFALTFIEKSALAMNLIMETPVTSFGGIVLNDNLYVYGGHTGSAHEYYREAQENILKQMGLKGDDRGQWKRLAEGPNVQGLALVAHVESETLYRLGGLQALNSRGENGNLKSIATVSSYHASKGVWQEQTPLPMPLSSVDAATSGDYLYVFGGWNMQGKGHDSQWASHGYVANLKQSPLKWEQTAPLPVSIRAMAVAATDRYAYMLGGLQNNGEMPQKTWQYDRVVDKWNEVAPFPAKTSMKGFGAAAFGTKDRVFLSGYDGRLYFYEEKQDRWFECQSKVEKRRFFHRLLGWDSRGKGLDKLLVVGGAKRNKTKEIEVFEISELVAGAQPISSMTEPASENLNEPVQKEQTEVKEEKPTSTSIWPAFRGQGHGVSTVKNLPYRESETQKPSWQVDIEGYGQSSPVIWGKLAFVTSVSGDMQEQLIISCYNIDDGKLNWEKSFQTSQQIKNDFYHSRAPGTPVLTESSIIAFFASGDLIALNHAGELQWQRSFSKEYGELKGNHGLGTSPILGSDATSVYISIDHEGLSYLIKVNSQTGETIWKVDRPSKVSWTTPTYHQTKDKELLLVSSTGSLDAYDPKDGTQVWHSSIEGNTVASPFSHDEWFIIPSKENDYFRVLKTDLLSTFKDQQNIESNSWTPESATISFGSPILYGQKMYSVSRSGTLYCNQVESGKLWWDIKLPSSCWASPIAAGKHIYFFCSEGEVVIIPANPGETAPEPYIFNLDISKKDKQKVYGAAVVDGFLLIRSGKKLFCYQSEL